MTSNHIQQSEVNTRFKKGSGRIFFQPKLTINQPGDQYEQEADAIANRIVQPRATFGGQHSFFKPALPQVQRKCTECEQEEKKVQRKELNKANSKDSSATEQYVSSLNGGGMGLSRSERNLFEPAFNVDFSQVRIHTDAKANESARSVNAYAYTHGNNVVFANSQYNPDTTAGKKLMAHELTHVVQQQGFLANSKSIQRNSPPASAPSTTTTTAPATTTPATASSTVSIAANCNQADITDIVTEALTWLDESYDQLLHFDAESVFSDVLAPSADHARIGGALQQAFNTTDLLYTEVIRRRLLHIAQLLRASGRININCDRQFCTSGGSSFVAAYVVGPYTLTMCSTGVPGSRPIATFIHELMHAAVPQVGISNTVTAGNGVSDRSYRGGRLFGHLSPEETLDNADSYAVLTELLHSRVNTQLVTPQADTATGCSQPAVPLEAFARASQWNAFALNGLQTDVGLLRGAALNTLNPGNLALLNAAFPGVATTADLDALTNAFVSLEHNGFNNSWDISCAGTRDRNCANSVSYSGGGVVTTSGVTLRNIRTQHTISLCPDWFTLSPEDRIKTIFAAFMLGRPSWITSGFQLQNAFDYIEGARHMTSEIIPAPTTTGAQQHIDSDARFRNPP